MKINIFVACLFIVLQVYSQNDTIKLKEIEVNANRVSTTYKNNLRLIQIISKQELQQMPIQSLTDVLDYVGAVDVRQRGVHSVQADVSIRGGNYEQTLVMINSVPVNDPQTGHHSMNIPIDMTMIERIEVLSGGDARRYGANAFSGVINIVTKEVTKNNLTVALAGGDFKYFEGQVNGMFKLGNTEHIVALSRYQSEGYRNNTDFNHSQFSWQGSQHRNQHHLQALFSIEDKAFGANSFYTPKYPHQYEQTHTLFSSLTHRYSWDKAFLTTQVYYRQHHDRFELFRHDLPTLQVPTWYKNHNYHLTQVLGGQSNVAIHSSLGKTTLGVDYRYEHIYSNVLGEPMNDTIDAPFETNGFFTRKAQKSYTSVFVDHSIEWHRFHFSAGLMATYLSTEHFYFYPGADLGYKLDSLWTIVGSVSRSLRLPTYTELYYKDAANEGNINLKPEQATNYEIGLKFNQDALQVQLSGFYRQGENIIDWVRLNVTDKWHTENISTVNTMGVEFTSCYNFTYRFPNFLIKNIRFNYAYIDITKQSGDYYSKYALDVLRHKVSLLLEHKITKQWSASWSVLYHERMGTYSEYPSGLEKSYTPYLTVDGRISYQFRQFTFYMSGSNLFDTYYYDIANIPMPGRWVKGGFIWSLRSN
ncbi:MAG: TonB-dependent receptor [Bacteroidales bacterium]|nr:TonB-dependent receptor [Bacteroidales bacterium]